MATTNTTYYQFVKPTPGTGEAVSVAAHLDDNWDKADAALRNLDIGKALTSHNDTQNASGTTTSTSFTATLAAGGTTCRVGFTAPLSGMVDVFLTARSFTSVTAFLFIGYHARNGAVLGAGTDFQVAADSRSIEDQQTTAAKRYTVKDRLKGLTPGAQYNLEMEFKISTGTLTVLDKDLSITIL